MMNSAIYQGLVTHTRFLPKRHHFAYRVFMVYLDLDEMDQLFSLSRLWSRERFNLASFRRSDYLGPTAIDLASAVRDEVQAQTGTRPQGRVSMLTNLRYFGFIINPITTYYCFDDNDQLTHVLAEVTNTPWRQRHAYVIPFSQNSADDGELQDFDKRLHVSPFMPLEMHYRWRNSVPGQALSIYMENHREGERQFSASMRLQRREISRAAMRNILVTYPFMTIKVVLGIYWQALKLWVKGIAFHPNPQKHAGSHPGKTDKKEKVLENHLS